MEIEKVLEERNKTHGDFEVQAGIAQAIDDIILKMPNYAAMCDVYKQSLKQISTKISRAGTGNPDDPEHWRDISGYATLAQRHAKGVSNE